MIDELAGHQFVPTQARLPRLGASSEAEVHRSVLASLVAGLQAGPQHGRNAVSPSSVIPIQGTMAQSKSPLPPPLSPHSSPSQSVQKTGPDTSVETLISYLVAAKRSLSSIHLVHRATTILSEARSAVEGTTGLIARTAYLRRSLASQLKILRGVQFELEGAAHGIRLEFQSVIKELDATEKKVAQCIGLLKATKVEDGFKRGTNTSPAETTEQCPSGEKDSLYDFVDDRPVEELKDAMKAAIDNVQSAQQEIGQSIQTLEEDLQSINEVLSNKMETSGTESELQQPHVPGLLTLLESDAREMADSLQSLVKHFDLCVTAIKHTEGGDAAVAQTVQTNDLPEGVGPEAFEAPAQPMTEEERVEMLHVLENDAAEVDDVVIEMQDRGADMEAQLDKILLWRERSEAFYNDVQTAFNLLEKVGGRLSSYVAETARQSARWAEERVKIEDGIAGMEDLCETYANFLHAYDGLIVEVARRRAVKKQMERVVQEAHARLDQLYEEDLAEREVFRTEKGDFLPGDIWPGVTSLPPRYSFSRLDYDPGGSVPELPRKTVEDALRRLKLGIGPPRRTE